MSTVKITRKQIRELVLDEQARRGGTVEAIVDEMLMLSPKKKERLGNLGELLVQKLIPGSKNLNKVKKSDFPFADILDGDLLDIDNAEFLSVKATSSVEGSAAVNNSPVKLSSIFGMFRGRGVDGISEEVASGASRNNKVRLGVVTVQPVAPFDPTRWGNFRTGFEPEKVLSNKTVADFRAFAGVNYFPYLTGNETLGIEDVNFLKGGPTQNKKYLTDRINFYLETLEEQSPGSSGIFILVLKYSAEFDISDAGFPVGINPSVTLRSNPKLIQTFGEPEILATINSNIGMEKFSKAQIESQLSIDLRIKRRRENVGGDSLSRERQNLLQNFEDRLIYLDNIQLKTIVDYMEEVIRSNQDVPASQNETIRKICNLLIESRKKLKNGCIPARRKISSGGKAGTYADARTGGKQAYAALKKAKPPGSKSGWTKSKNICCHKCPNDRSAPNGYVCINPSHLYWGTKGDNTTDQWHGNGSAQNEEKLRSDIKAMIWELIPEEVLKNSE